MTPSNVQWGKASEKADIIPYPIKFPTTVFGAYLSANAPNMKWYEPEQNKLYVQEWSFHYVNTKEVSFRQITGLGENGVRYWIVIGK